MVIKEWNKFELMKAIKNETYKTPAANERFCVMAAVTPRKRQCEIESLYPAGSVVEAATT
jgi:hypothetical protein